MATPSNRYIGWSYEKQITVSSTNIDSDLTDFPLYVEFNSDSDVYWNARSDGHDIRFALEDGTNLPYERVGWDYAPTTASGRFFVRIDLDNATGATLYMLYGKAAPLQSTPSRMGSAVESNVVNGGAV